MEFMASLPAREKVVLVGYRFSGFVISKAMESFPEKISVAVFVTALMSGVHLSQPKIRDHDGTYSILPRITDDASKEEPQGSIFRGRQICTCT